MWNDSVEAANETLDGESLAIYQTVVGFNVLYIFVGVLGNLATILAICNSRKLRNKVSSWFIASLALSDLIFCSVCLPIHNYALLNMDVFEREGIRFCPWISLVTYGTCTTSSTSLLLITLNRYVAIVHNKRYPSLYSPRSTVCQIAFAWLAIYTVLLLPAYEQFGRFGWYNNLHKRCDFMEDRHGFNPMRLFTVLFAVIPCQIMIFCYGMIFRSVRQSRLHLQSFSEKKNSDSPQAKISKSEIKLAKTMMVTLLVLLCSYSPFAVIQLYGLDKFSLLPPYITYILGSSTATTNFIIYAACHPQYRKAYLELLPLESQFIKRLKTLSLGSGSGSST